MTHVIELRMSKEYLSVSFDGISFTAIDDGGLCRRVKTSTGNFVVDDNFVAIVEAKRAYPVKDGRPVVSDPVLGQMTCQALAVRRARESSTKADRYDLGRGYSVIRKQKLTC